MPNSYHYFESGEVSSDRFLIEIELLKQLQTADLLHDLDWTSYDTPALISFVQAGINEAKDELALRHTDHGNVSEERQAQEDFIGQCLERHRQTLIAQNYPDKRISRHMIVNIVFVLVSLIFLLGFFIYEYVRFSGHHPFMLTLHRPLTTQRRHLSFTDDLFVVVVAVSGGLILGCIIATTRVSRKMILLEMFAFFIVVLLLIGKVQQIIRFLTMFREQPSSRLYAYMYSW